MKFGRYEIPNEAEDILGKGAMGIVYRAHDPLLNRQVAIKVLHKKLLYDDEAVRGFLKEATLNASLSHPNILTILDVGEEWGEVYIAMELLEGVPLSKMMQSLEHSQIVSIGMQIADALDFAHRKGVVHRDIKPANIIVRNDGQIKITDFGIAKGIGGGGDDLLETQTGVIKGTPAYMSPEQAKGDSKNVDGRSDLFSLGVILYEMSTGKRPFLGDGSSPYTVLDEVIKKKPVEPCKVKETVNRGLSSVIMKALQKEPAERFQTGNELVSALSGCEERKAAQVKPAPKRTFIYAGGAVGTAVLAVAGFFVFGPGKKEVPKPPQPVAVAPVPVAQPVAAQSIVPTSVPVPAALSQVAKPEPVKPAVVKVEAAKPPKAELAVATKRTKQKKETVAKLEPAPVAQPKPTIATEAPATDEPKAVRYAFLKVGTSPAGAQVYVNGSLKGMTPLKLRLNLGKYKVRLARAGYKSVETSVNLDRMAEFPISEEMSKE